MYPDLPSILKFVKRFGQTSWCQGSNTRGKGSQGARWKSGGVRDSETGKDDKQTIFLHKTLGGRVDDHPVHPWLEGGHLLTLLGFDMCRWCHISSLGLPGALKSFCQADIQKRKAEKNRSSLSRRYFSIEDVSGEGSQLTEF